MPKFNKFFSTMLILTLAACSEPSIETVTEILDTYDKGENEELIKNYLTDNGYKCLKPNEKIILTADEVGGEFENSKEFTYFSWSPAKYITDYDEFCWKGKDSIRVDLEKSIIKSKSPQNSSVYSVSFDQYTSKKTGNDVKRMKLSCAVLDMCAGNLAEFQKHLQEKLKYDFFIVEKKKVNWSDVAEFAAPSENGNTAIAEYMIYSRVTIGMKKESIEVSKGVIQDTANAKKAEKDKVNKIKQYGAGSVYKPNSVTMREYNKYIRLQCGTTVDCSNHSSVVSQVAAAYKSIKNSPNRYAQGYASACLDGFSTLRTLPSHLHGDAGIYPAQFMACNEAMIYHFVKN